MDNTKVCIRCNQVKLLNEFPKRGSGYRNDCKVCNLEYHKNLYLKKRSQRLLQVKQYYYANYETKIAYNQNYQSVNRIDLAEKRAAKRANNLLVERKRQRDWARNNRDKVAKSERKYYETHPEMIRKKQAARRAKQSGNKTYLITKSEWLKFYAQECFYCKSKTKTMTIEHLIPISRGGNHSIGNLTTLCLSCNSSKSGKTWMEWRMWKLKNEI
jgi:5-methylcytosine-specific restriction endonuclease McrA